jgi:hypothetical protein
MSRQRTKTLVARVEEEIALAQATAQKVLTASANFSQTTNPGVLGPAPTIVFPAPAFSTKVGTTVSVRAIATGLASVAGDVADLTLFKDGVQIPAIPIPAVNSGTTGLFALVAECIDTVVVGVPHVYSAQISDLSGGNVTIGPHSVMIILEERPAP